MDQGLHPCCRSQSLRVMGGSQCLWCRSQCLWYNSIWASVYGSLVIIVSAQVLLVLTLGLWDFRLGLDNLFGYNYRFGVGKQKYIVHDFVLLELCSVVCEGSRKWCIEILAIFEQICWNWSHPNVSAVYCFSGHSHPSKLSGHDLYHYHFWQNKNLWIWVKRRLTQHLPLEGADLHVLSGHVVANGAEM